MDVLGQLPDERDAWRPAAEIPWDHVTETGRRRGAGPHPVLLEEDRGLYHESDDERAEREARAEECEPYLRLIEFLQPLLPRRQGEVVAAYLSGSQLFEIANAMNTARQTVHIHWRRALVALTRHVAAVEAVAAFAGVPSRPPFRSGLAEFAYGVATRLSMRPGSVMMLKLNGIGGQRRIAAALGISQRTVRQYLDRVTDAVWLEAHESGEAEAGRQMVQFVRTCREPVEVAYGLSRDEAVELRRAVAGAWLGRVRGRVTMVEPSEADAEAAAAGLETLLDGRTEG